jgi:bifunctional non-homologous end joining protein LigD
MTPTIYQRIELSFKEGGSNKVYKAQVLGDGAGYYVNFQYGRRGNAMTSGTKTPIPLTTLSKAEDIYHKLVREKTSKGYRPEGEGQGVITTCEANDTGIRCQLCNTIDKKELEHLLNNDEWVMQRKFDGVRLLVKVNHGTAIGINRRGMEVPLNPMLIRDLLMQKPVEAIYDGELVGDMYHVFDLIEQDENRLHRRLLHLKEDVYTMPHVERVNGYVLTDKRLLFEHLKGTHAEGVVFKRLDSYYRPGRPNSGGSWLKYKFVETCSCIVGKGREDKNSVSLWMTDENDEQQTCVGNVTVKANDIMPPINSVVEVRYLYAYKEGSLFQPVLIGPRDDIPRTECSLDQLKYKPE